MIKINFLQSLRRALRATEAIVCNCGALAPSFHTREANEKLLNFKSERSEDVLHNRIMGFEAKARSRLVVFGVSLALLILGGAVLQTSVFGKLTYIGAVPDIMLCIVTCVAYFNGRHHGAITGLAAGAFIEAIASSGIVLLPLFYMLFGYIAGHYARAVQPKRFVPYLFYLMFALFLRAGLTVLYACLTYQSIHLLQILVHAGRPEMLATALAGICLYFPLMLFCRKVKA